ncbi:diaminopimelate epimerase [Rapidithrix thailandica]|uniref:Diaminopimelate epimerase n=1 Tax=Rapidithrix thailandica TaxID=413964 RepID=A0AAW9SD72_9BACT
MLVNFYKYQGTGNDFVIIDDREEQFDIANYQLVNWLCHRRFGIGADGLILLRNAEGYDFRMVYFNADGHEGSMCGNGGRCIVAFAKFLGIFDKQTSFIAVDGPHQAFVKEGLVHLKMGNVEEIETGKDFFFMDTGSPHYIQFVKNIEDIDVVKEGQKIRYNDRFAAEGTNVNFVQKSDNNSIKVRTYERGVEDETLSCGTGVTASAIAANQQGMQSPIDVEALGGNLQIAFQQTNHLYQDIYLTGPAQQVFKGTIDTQLFKG